MPAPQAFPPIPNEELWSAEAHEAYIILRDMYHHSRDVLRREENEPIRLNILWSEINSRAVPLLEALQQSGVSEEWVEAATHRFGQLSVDLKSAETAADGR